MSGYGHTNKLATYQSVATHGGVAAADSHRLVLLLIDGALERVAMARGFMERGTHAEKSRLLHRAVAILDELRNSLDLDSGGELARNLDSLYEYMCRRLMQASTENRLAMLDEVSALLTDIRGAWAAIPPGSRGRPAGSSIGGQPIGGQR
jgi:flagellar secretion chaperone FliS